jgi:dienelactone hydrolase
MRFQLILAVVVASSVAGLGGSQASARESAVSISVDRPVALVDTPLRIRVLGLRPHRRVKVLARTRDGIGRAWSSWASFRADRNGRVDLGRARALGGSYRGTAAMGLFWSMLPRKAGLTEPFPPPAVEAVTLSVQVNRRVLRRRRVVRKLIAPGVLVRDQRPAAVGFYGELFLPVHTARRRPGVLLFGGSDGGLTTAQEAALLASRGYTSLALAYFRAPGLPRSLSEIPLDYFAAALRFLRDQPGVDPAHLVVQGTSRGSEAALLLGVHYPDLVHAVIALVPSNVAICSFPGCTRSAWLLDGAPVPYTRQFNEPHPTDEPRAVIPVERIQGPIFLACGGADTVWVSCSYARAITARRRAHRTPHRSVLAAFPDAGHEVGYPVPYLPGRFAVTEGLTPDANPRAQARLWPRLLAFLGMVGAGGR